MLTGKVTGDRGLEAEGKAQQAGRHLKRGPEKVADSATGAVPGARQSNAPRRSREAGPGPRLRVSALCRSAQRGVQPLADADTGQRLAADA